jgi:hypothetical protein
LSPKEELLAAVRRAFARNAQEREHRAHQQVGLTGTAPPPLATEPSPGP